MLLIFLYAWLKKLFLPRGKYIALKDVLILLNLKFVVFAYLNWLFAQSFVREFN